MSELKTRSFPSAMKKAEPLGNNEDRSHKVSLYQVNTQHQTVAQHPNTVFGTDYYHQIEDNTDARYMTQAQQRRLTVSLNYLQNHAPYSQPQPMSPTSQRASRFVHDAFANKNADNLRNYDAGVNRSIGEFPHMTINNGQLSPRSQGLIGVVNRFEELAGQYLDERQATVTQSYTDMQYGPPTHTDDQRHWAKDYR